MVFIEPRPIHIGRCAPGFFFGQAAFIAMLAGKSRQRGGGEGVEYAGLGAFLHAGFVFGGNNKYRAAGNCGNFTAARRVESAFVNAGIDDRIKYCRLSRRGN